MTILSSPKPSLFLQIQSVLLLGGNLYLLSKSLGVMMIAWDPCGPISGAMGISLLVPLGVLQFRGTFRGEPTAARAIGTILLSIGCSVLVLVSIMFGRSVLFFSHPPVLEETLRLQMTLFIGGAVFCLLAWPNLRWAGELKQAELHQVQPSKNRRFQYLDLVACLIAVAIVIPLTLYEIRAIRPQFAEHITSERVGFHLPEGASDVSYCRSFRGAIAFEFSTDEEHFREWAEELGSFEANMTGAHVEQIANCFTIKRFYCLSTKLDGPESITICHGLRYDFRKEDRSIQAAFDIKTRRAYYAASFH